MIRNQASLDEALAECFQAFYSRGPANRWRWLATGDSILAHGQQQQQIHPFLEDEVKAAMQGLNSKGAPRTKWHPNVLLQGLLGYEVIAALEDFKTDRCQMDRLNKAYIVILLKVQGAEQISDFRPISLSNSLHLIFAKVLANWL